MLILLADKTKIITYSLVLIVGILIFLIGAFFWIRYRSDSSW
ncbi:Uncharacterised protein, partial [Mycoplasma putrefaciens]